MRLQTLQAARGIAANLVLMAHLFAVDTKYAGGDVMPSWALYGVAGVDLFFVLSGFIMVAVAGVSIGPAEFLWRRIARIYPTYWLVSLGVLAVALIAPAIVNSSVHGQISLWRSFLLIPGSTPPLLAVGWTLIHEMYFYIVFAIFLAFGLPTILGLLAWAALIIAIALIAPDQVAASPVLHVVTSPLTAEFMMGALIGTLWRNKIATGAIPAAAIGGAALALAILWIAPALSLATSPHLDFWRVAVFGIPCALIIYGLTGIESHYQASPWRLLVIIGDGSYAIYLLHVLVISTIGRAMAFIFPSGGIESGILLVAIGAAAANAAGILLYIIFERPTLRWLS